MKDQHKKITGYRDLSQQEIDLMNLIKKKGEEMGLLLKTIEEMRLDQRNMAGILRTEVIEDVSKTDISESMRCLALAKTNMQQGLMWAVRGIALPQSF